MPKTTKLVAASTPRDGHRHRRSHRGSDLTLVRGLPNPMLAGAAMAFSSVFVVGNSLGPRGFQSFTPS